MFTTNASPNIEVPLPVCDTENKKKTVSGLQKEKFILK
jgi:hypothetical protein